MAVLLWILAVFPIPWFADALFRLFWAMKSKRCTPEESHVGSKPINHVMVLIPSRGESEKLVPTLQSVLMNKGHTKVEPVVILDGPDPIGEEIARQLGVRVLLKEGAGPTKGAVLRFAAEALQQDILSADAVMVLDVGSLLQEGFFAGLSWPPGVSVLQARLQGSGCGPGEAASVSERLAQEVWDQGKEAAGWCVQLRGTGTIFQPATFLRLVPNLQTQVEDTEATLLLQAAGERSCLLSSAVVADRKPETLKEASRQRARWLVGQLQLLVKQKKALWRLARRQPVAALAWATALFSRPLSLSVPGRLLFGATLSLLACTEGSLAFCLWGFLVVISALVEVSWFLISYPQVVGSALQLAWAWLGALLLWPRARKRWLAGRRGSL
ncbi:MAG: glycosyltransferase [Thermoanaerobaculaceae bacterium]